MADNLIDRNSGVSLRTYVRPQSFFGFRSDLVCGLASTIYAQQYELDPIQGRLSLYSNDAASARWPNFFSKGDCGIS